MFGAIVTPPSTLLKRFSSPAPFTSVRAPVAIRLRITCASTCQAPPSMPHQLADFVSRKMPASLYEVLQVKQNASVMEIKTAYRTMAKVYHPDATSQADSDGRDFIEIHNAYATLSDPAARAMYDLSLGRLQRRTDRSEAYATRRWETDQCW